MLTKIENLNKKIDALMKEKTKADAQKEVWENRLLESIKGYNQEYGVDLSAKNVAGIKEKLSVEIGKVEAQTKEEYERAQKIVSLIQAGDIKGAWLEVGVDLDAVVQEEPEVVTPVKEIQEEKGLQGISDAVSEVDDFDEADLFGFGADITVDETEVKEEEVVVAQPEKTKKPVMNITFDDDDDDDFIMQPVKAEPKKEEKKTASFMLDDDDDDDFGGFGGFGGVLAGSPFEVKK